MTAEKFISLARNEIESNGMLDVSISVPWQQGARWRFVLCKRGGGSEIIDLGWPGMVKMADLLSRMSPHAEKPE